MIVGGKYMIYRSQKQLYKISERYKQGLNGSSLIRNCTIKRKIENKLLLSVYKKSFNAIQGVIRNKAKKSRIEKIIYDSFQNGTFQFLLFSSYTS